MTVYWGVAAVCEVVSVAGNQSDAGSIATRLDFRGALAGVGKHLAPKAGTLTQRHAAINSVATCPILGAPAGTKNLYPNLQLIGEPKVRSRTK